jgi:hypothetical protein
MPLAEGDLPQGGRTALLYRYRTGRTSRTHHASYGYGRTSALTAEDVAQRRRCEGVRRKMRRMAAGILLVVLAGCRPTSHVAVPSPTPPAAAEVVRVNGLEVPVPSGWHKGVLLCEGPQDHSVNVDAKPGGASCPVFQPPTTPPTEVTVHEGYQPQSYGVTGFRGRRIVWQGQPAWTLSYAVKGVTTEELWLPWLNALVEAESTDAKQAHDLAFSGRPVVTRSLVTMSRVTSVLVQPWPQTGSRVNLARTFRAAADVAIILHDLRAVPPTSDPTRACSPTFALTAANITLIAPGGNVQQTFQARFGCGLLLGGTGTAGSLAGSALRRDLRRLLPSSGL